MFSIGKPVYALVTLSVLCGPLYACGAEGISNVAESTLNPTMDGVEWANRWKDDGPEQLRFGKCLEQNGLWVERLTISACQDGYATVNADDVVTKQPCGPGHNELVTDLQCAYRDALGHLYFNDGPSVPPAMLTLSSWLDPSIDQMRYNELFWQAGVNHDNCYHNNPITYGLTRAECDERFIDDLLSTCAHTESQGLDWFKNSVCKTYAQLMYGMVRKHGGESYEAVNLEAHYGLPEPLFMTYGMTASPYTEACRTETEDFLAKMKIISDPNQPD